MIDLVWQIFNYNDYLIMSTLNRDFTPLVKILENNLLSIEDSINQILKINVNSIWNENELMFIADKCEVSYKQYCNVNFKLVKYPNSYALAEPEHLIKIKQHLRKEVSDFLILVKSRLGDLHEGRSVCTHKGKLLVSKAMPSQKSDMHSILASHPKAGVDVGQLRSNLGDAPAFLKNTVRGPPFSSSSSSFRPFFQSVGHLHPVCKSTLSCVSSSIVVSSVGSSLSSCVPGVTSITTSTYAKQPICTVGRPPSHARSLPLFISNAIRSKLPTSETRVSVLSSDTWSRPPTAVGHPPQSTVGSGTPPAIESLARPVVKSLTPPVIEHLARPVVRRLFSQKIESLPPSEDVSASSPEEVSAPPPEEASASPRPKEVSASPRPKEVSTSPRPKEVSATQSTIIVGVV